MAVSLSGAMCLACGFLVVSLGWANRARSFSEGLFAASLAAGFGLGIFSVIYFLSLLLQTQRLIVVDVVTLASLMVMFLWRRAHRSTGEVRVRKNDALEPEWLHRLLSAGFAIALCCALYSAIMRALAYPHGDGWDAFAIWNLRARFLFRGGPHWRDGSTALLPWSHPDYPLLLPAAVAHFWSYIGGEDPMAPAVIGIVFTFSTAGLLFSALSILRGRSVAKLATTALLATPAFVELGTSQYADVPLSFFFLATTVLLCLCEDRSQHGASPNAAGLLVLAGLAASFAAWTKNEGLLFLCAIVLARLFVLACWPDRAGSPDRVRAIIPILIGMVPTCFLIAGFKHYLAPPGDLLSDPSALHKLLDPVRYWAITKWYFKEFFRFGRWLLIPTPVLMIAYYWAAGQKEEEGPRLGLHTSVLALSLTLAGYFAVYLITPYDIYWHLRFSLSRLFLQVWPSSIFVFFLLVRPSLPSHTQLSAASQGANVSK